MVNLINSTQNFAMFKLDFDPDGGPGYTAQKLLFSAWNATQNSRFAYVETDQDPNPAAELPASASFGNIVTSNPTTYAGTCPNWEQGSTHIGDFVMGMFAAVNWSAQNGRITAAFKSQNGLQASVTNATQALNLGGNPQAPNSFGNGYNFYGAFATATQNFVFYQRGTISGSYLWLDSYINQIWLNQSFIGDIALLLTTLNSIPYTAVGYSLIEQGIQGTINQALNNGVISAGVTLSPSEIADVNQAAGLNIASVLQSRGWYLLAQPATPTQRQNRTSPPFTFYYTDGGSIQAITMPSIALQ
jgi:hypothetical protein